VSGVLFVNPRSGKGGPSAEELADAARALGIRTHVLRPGEDLERLAREADADVLGAAGGDGSLGVVAAAAIERELPFVCVPFGTRNHFAGDVGLDTADPIAGLRAFQSAVERRIDVGRIGERVFLNNVSLGIYALLVHRREHRRRQREVFARLKALALTLRDGSLREHFVVDGDPVEASVVLVANNEYRLDAFSLGARERLDEGTLVLYAARGLRRLRWAERRAKELEIATSRRSVRVAVDGEPAMFSSPLLLRIEPGALRLRVPEPR
jgi:diacylglycerol kinase family enzyme